MKEAGANQDQKRSVGIKAAALVVTGQTVGLGTGSTAAFFIEDLGRRVRSEGLILKCVTTSFSSSVLAREHGLTVLPLDDFDSLDISVDGADEIDPASCLIKGGGAAHAREKLVHAMSKRFVVIADASKRVQNLGEKFPVPVECIPQSVRFVLRKLGELGGNPGIRMAKGGKDGPIVTDNGNLVIDVFLKLSDPEKMEREINSIPGVLDNGIFAIVKPAEVLIAD
ncbi:MAG: ribose-5-phosphate isomerase RpiA [Spirochaetia bacterium]|nr:ribose-5-phosphate isomerase RpiA [Spirochaetia bacterium]